MSWILSKEARSVIEEIEDYTAMTWGDTQAARYVEALFQAFHKLGDNPALGRSRPDVPPPFLVYAVGSHLIVYRHNWPGIGQRF
ncbi:type II toxin-antitoxin system RelE/ParE family toxin [Asticcacaulis sp.]|uniref:type II toxin-antitoxin system RelE/ParE family toxin n=1 Tax=Asticcacaulis sp. TaxID=1872648 RepID=UPI003F7B75E7